MCPFEHKLLNSSVESMKFATTSVAVLEKKRRQDMTDTVFKLS